MRRLILAALMAAATASICSSGRYNSGGGNCADCPYGKYQSSAGASSCQVCPAGRFQDEARSTACKEKCAAGRYLIKGPIPACRKCNAGEFGNAAVSNGDASVDLLVTSKADRNANKLHCQACPTGQYQSAPGSTSCLTQNTCAAGRHVVKTAASNPLTALQQCLDCEAGRYQPSEDQPGCSSCPQEQITPFVAGKYQPLAGQASCLGHRVCKPGQSRTADGDALKDVTCAMCAPGRFTSTENDVMCRFFTPCPKGSSEAAQPTLANDRTCSPCPKGTWWEAKQQLDTDITCSSHNSAAQCAESQGCTWLPTLKGATQGGCVANPYAADWSTCNGLANSASCEKNARCHWMADHYSGSAAKCVVNGGGTCNACAAGQYQSLVGQTACVACSNTLVQPEEGQSRCVEPQTCLPGTYVSQPIPADRSADRQCASCASARFSETANQAACVDHEQCKKGEFAVITASPSNNRVCQMCAAGKYNPLTRALNEESCQLCAKGTYAANAGMDACLPCNAAVEYQPDAGQAFCEKHDVCAPGKYYQQVFRTAEATGPCKDCDAAAGSFTDQSNQIVCKSMKICEAGQYEALAGTASRNRECQDCAAGQYNLAGTSAATAATSCQSCAAGRYADAAKSSSCKQCESGKYQTATGQASCTTWSNCQPGTRVDTGTGKSANTVRDRACVTCEIGQITTDTNKLSCAECADGQYQASAGQAFCDTHEVCMPGKYFDAGSRSTTDTSTCKHCESGKYTDTPNANECLSWKNCDPGYKQTKAASEKSQRQCVACTPGHFTHTHMFTANTSPTTCSKCAPGKYQDDIAQSGCSNCDVGFYQDLEAQSTCKPHTVCVTGRFMSKAPTSTNDRECSDCSSGTFTSTSNEDHCKPHTQCTAGKYEEDYPNASTDRKCTMCNAGHFTDAQSATTATQCKSCPAGKFAENAGASECQDCADNKYQDFTGKASCKTKRQCVPGKRDTSDETQLKTTDRTCESCRAGQYSGTTNSATCSACLAGEYQAVEGKAFCSAHVKCEPGKYFQQDSRSITKTSACQTCPPNHYTNDIDQQACIPQTTCTAGKYASVLGTTSIPRVCTVCPAGKFSGYDGAAQCELCSAGQSQDTAGQNSCKECAAGDHQKLMGQVSCSPFTDCRPGQIMTSQGSKMTGDHTCSDCPAGRYMDTVNTLGPCKQCGKGKFSGTTAAASCLDCAPGTYASSTSQTSCAACAVGRFGDAAGLQTNCKACPAQHYQALAGQTYCNPFAVCSPGQKVVLQGSNTTPRTCIDCVAGQFSATKNSGSCTACCTAGAACGVYQSDVGQPTCLDQPVCRSGQYTRNRDALENAVGTVRRDCAQCAYGEFQAQSTPSDSDSCSAWQICAAGSFEVLAPTSRADRGCRACKAGKYSAAAGAKSCTDCVAGKKSGAAGATSCAACAVGQYSEAPGQTFCYHQAVCAPGKYIDPQNVGTTSSARACKDCAVARYTDNADLTQCKDCLPGQYQVGTGMGYCVACESGKYESNNECHDCQVGKMGFAPGVAACHDCPTGRYQDKTGQNCCITQPPCATGKFVSVAPTSISLVQCSECAPGRFTENRNEAACSTCPNGQTQAVSGMSYCTSCTRGRYEPVVADASGAMVGNNTCVECAKNFYGPSVGATTCLACTAGQYQPNTGKAACIPEGSCASGRFVRCDPLDPTYNPTAADCHAENRCTPCESGKYSDSYNSKGAFDTATQQMVGCKMCPTGKFQPLPEKSDCLKEAACAAGKWQAVAPTDTTEGECHACTPGQFKAKAGNIEQCQPCAAGQYMETEGMSTCNKCRPGYSQPLTGKTSCTMCGDGQVQPDEGKVACSNCAKGKYMPTHRTDRTTCSTCVQGQFNIVEGATECTKCSMGTFGDSTQLQDAATHCTDCAPGKHQEIEGSSMCQVCVAGKNSGTGWGKCCGYGEFQDQKGVASCKSCDAGKFQNALGSALCEACATGTGSQSGWGSCCGSGQKGVAGQKQELTCQGCGSGTFNDVPGAAQCKSCAGTFSGVVHQVQQTCPAGKYQETRLVPVKEQNEAAGNGCACVGCVAGQYTIDHTPGSCIHCEPGKYQPAPMETTCTECQQGKFSNVVAAVDSATCKQCPYGKFAEGAAAVCGTCSDQNLRCGSGKFRMTTSSSCACKACPGGQYQDDNEAIECKLCSSGKYAEVPTGDKFNKACKACARGKYTGSFGMKACTDCKPGRFWSPLQQQDTHAVCTQSSVFSSQTECAKHDFCSWIADLSGPMVAIADYDGSALDGVLSFHKGDPVRVFKKKSGDWLDAEIHGFKGRVPAGFVGPVAGSGGCISKTYELQYNDCKSRSTANDCTKDNFCNWVMLDAYTSQGPRCVVSGGGTCKDCTAGKFQPLTAQTSCTNCEAAAHVNDRGKYRALLGEHTDCLSCAVGTYAPTVGATICQNDPCYVNGEQATRKYCNNRGIPKRDDFTAGRHQKCVCIGCISSTGDKCESTPAPTPAPTMHPTPAPTPRICSTDKHHCASLPGGICYDVPIQGDNEGHRCGCQTGFMETWPTNVVQNTHKHHMKCTLITAAPTTFPTPFPTPAPTLAPTLSPTRFPTPIPTQLCTRGKYRNVHNERGQQCVRCAAGMHSDVDNAVQCKYCPAGKFAKEGAQNCEECALGQYQPSVLQASCKSCPAGRFADRKASLHCVRCAVNHWAHDTGSKKCASCPINTRAPVAGATNCIYEAPACPTPAPTLANANPVNAQCEADLKKEKKERGDEQKQAQLTLAQEQDKVKVAQDERDNAISLRQTCTQNNVLLQQRHKADDTSLSNCNAAKDLLSTTLANVNADHTKCKNDFSSHKSTSETSLATEIQSRDTYKAERDTFKAERDAFQTERDTLQTSLTTVQTSLERSVDVDLDQNGIVDTVDSVDFYIAVNLPQNYGGEVLMSRLQNTQTEHMPQRTPAQIYAIVAAKVANVQAVGTSV